MTGVGGSGDSRRRPREGRTDSGRDPRQDTPLHVDPSDYNGKFRALDRTPV